MSKQEVKDKIREVSKKQDIDPFLMLAFASVESNFNPNAIGDNGTSFGLFQIKLVTARDVGSFPKDISDEELIRLLLMPGPATSTAIKYYKYQLNRYRNKIHAIAAYNKGSAVVNPDGRYSNQRYIDRVNTAYKRESGKYLFPKSLGKGSIGLPPVVMLSLISFIVIMGSKGK